ncbi:MAG: hypothetical protein AMXMBFR83_24700 [Phycisphaerae bacterium]
MRSSIQVGALAWTALVLTVVGPIRAQTPLGPAFSFQGRLKQNGQPVNGTVTLAFSLYDAAGAGSPPVGGNQLGVEQTVAGVGVTDGLFTVVLNSAGQFGTNAFDGNARWLQIAVNGTVLAPRQPVNPAPYALVVPGLDGHSLNASDGNPQDALYVDAAGRVGIGTTSPQSLLHINGNERSLRLQNGSQIYDFLAEPFLFRLRANDKDVLRYEPVPDNFTLGGGSQGVTTAQGSVSVKSRLAVGTNVDQNWTVYLNGDTLIKGTKLILDAGSIGVGTHNPQAKLHVVGTVRSSIVEITGGADLAEPFEVRGQQEVRPGMVVSIDPEHPGELRVATQAYDPTVAGVISGAKGLSAGLVLRQEGTSADGKHPVALTGRVWCWCDADAGGAIAPGSLLTTSDTPGHAMKVGDHARAQGAVIGKAMSRLDKGQGLVLVLVNLQ